MAHERLSVPLPFEELLQHNEREIMRYLLRVSGNRGDTDDLFTESGLRAYHAAPRLQPESDARPWLYAVTNLCCNRARNGARRARVIVSDGKERSATEAAGKHHPSSQEKDGYAIEAASPVRDRRPTL